MRRDRNGLEILGRDECQQLLASQFLGRIGVTVNALPVVLPVNYQLFDGQLIIQTERDTRLADANSQHGRRVRSRQRRCARIRRLERRHHRHRQRSH